MIDNEGLAISRTRAILKFQKLHLPSIVVDSAVRNFLAPQDGIKELRSIGRIFGLFEDR